MYEWSKLKSSAYKNLNLIAHASHAKAISISLCFVRAINYTYLVQNHVLCIGVPLIGPLRISLFMIIIVDVLAVLSAVLLLLLLPVLLGRLYLDDCQLVVGQLRRWVLCCCCHFLSIIVNLHLLFSVFWKVQT